MTSAKLFLSALGAMSVLASPVLVLAQPGFDGGGYMRQVRDRPNRAERQEARGDRRYDRRADGRERRRPAAPCGGDLIGAIAGGLVGSGSGPARDRPAGRRC